MYYLWITVAVLTTPSTVAVGEVECGYLYILSSSRSSVTILISGRTHYVSIGINCRASALRCDKSVGCEAGAGCGLRGVGVRGGGASIQRDVSEWCAASGVSAREHCRRRQVQPARSLPAPRCHCAATSHPVTSVDIIWCTIMQCVAIGYSLWAWCVITCS